MCASKSRTRIALGLGALLVLLARPQAARADRCDRAGLASITSSFKSMGEATRAAFAAAALGERCAAELPSSLAALLGDLGRLAPMQRRIRVARTFLSDPALWIRACPAGLRVLGRSAQLVQPEGRALIHRECGIDPARLFSAAEARAASGSVELALVVASWMKGRRFEASLVRAFARALAGVPARSVAPAPSSRPPGVGRRLHVVGTLGKGGPSILGRGDLGRLDALEAAGVGAGGRGVLGLLGKGRFRVTTLALEALPIVKSRYQLLWRADLMACWSLHHGPGGGRLPVSLRVHFAPDGRMGRLDLQPRTVARSDWGRCVKRRAAAWRLPAATERRDLSVRLSLER